MSSFWNFLFGAVLILIWIIAGGFITQSNVFLHPYRNDDSDMHRAYWFTFWGAFVTWFLIGLFIILIILSVVGVIALFGTGAGEVGAVAEGAEGASLAAGEAEESYFSRYMSTPQGQKNTNTGVSWITIVFLFLALLLVGVTGILAAIAATSMIKSSKYNPSVSRLKTAYINCIIAASLCLGAGGLLIIGIIVYFIIGIERQRRYDARKELMEKEKRIQLAEIEQLREQSTR